MNDEERRAYNRKYYAEHREKILGQKKARNENDPNYRTKCAVYREANREKLRERAREYRNRKKAEIWNQLKKGNENGTRA